MFSTTRLIVRTIVLISVAQAAQRAFAESTLDSELAKLYGKYGRESVLRKIERDNPKTIAAETQASVPKDALAPEKKEEQSGFRLFSQQRFPILFRRSYSDVTAGEDPSAPSPKSLKQAEPAQFSYSHDYLAGSDQWSVIAALIMPIELVNRDSRPVPYEGLELRILDFVPSVSLNRIDNSKDSTKNVDELTFRAGVYGKWLGIAGPLRLLKLSAYATYATSSEFSNDGIVAGEVDFEPITALHGNRTFYRLAANDTGRSGRPGSLIEYHWRAYLHSEFGRHIGTASSATSDDE
ncbi:MAG: hypothetical protein QOD64_1231, partial [Verrucomicrobiota bacterium]